MIAEQHRPSLDDLLNEMRARRWTVHTFGPENAPELVCAAIHWGDRCSDVLILRSENQATAFRSVRVGVREDLFAPNQVLWQYHGRPEWTVRAVLTIPAPGDHGAPSGLETAHPLCRVPVELRQRATVRQAGLVQSPSWAIR
ncbi:Hypothetical protein AJAP_27845 [Amycolatopsis japonica]|uniref:Uncharacterized protein n=1 Tax=Amycolatopsis japonica TaxID=208439 RepID=A0A075V1E7_9PSEU|nr:Hypothetical protein AJAP_27845 [Amycolatopsis japonica]